MKKIFVVGLIVFSISNAIGQIENQVKFTAKIANRNSDSLEIRGANNFRQVIRMDKNDVFAATLTAPKGFYQFSDGIAASSFYLKPDSEIHLTMDAKAFEETIVYEGKGVNESNFLAQQTLHDKKFQKEAFLEEPVTFLKLLKEKKEADIALVNKGDFDPDFKKKLLGSLDQYSQYELQEYKSAFRKRKIDIKPSPEFDYENYNGGKTKLSDLKGKYVYIDIWATWCGPCRVEIPFLQKIEEKYHDKNIAFVSISIDKIQDKEKWKKLVAAKNLGGIQLIADKDWASDFIVKQEVTEIPRFILIGPKGNILDAVAPRPSSVALKAELDSLLLH